MEKMFCEVASGNINTTKGFPESLGIVEGVVGVYYNKLEFGYELIKAVGCEKKFVNISYGLRLIEQEKMFREYFSF